MNTNTIEQSIDGGSKITKQQSERVNSLLHFYNDDHALEIVLALSGTGPNSWSAVQQRITDIVRSTKTDKMYLDGFIDTFEIGAVVTFNEIIQKVSTIRAELELDSYSNLIKPQCEADLAKAFILKRAYAPLEEGANPKSRKFIGYIPVVKLKAE